MEQEFISALKKYTNKKILKSKLMNSSQNIVYLCSTKKNKYIVKRYSKDAIRNSKELKERKEQIRISKIWNNFGITCAIPLTDIFKYNGYYYIIYQYIKGKIKDVDYALYACWNGKIQWMYYLTNKDPFK